MGRNTLIEELWGLIGTWDAERYPNPEDPQGWRDTERWKCQDELKEILDKYSKT